MHGVLCLGYVICKYLLPLYKSGWRIQFLFFIKVLDKNLEDSKEQIPVQNVTQK